MTSEGGGSGGGSTISGGQPNKLYYVIPKSSSSIVGTQNVSGGNPIGTTTKTMILNGKEAKTVLLSSTAAG